MRLPLPEAVLAVGAVPEEIRRPISLSKGHLMGIPAVMLYTLMWAACFVFFAITLRTAETASPATTMWWAVVGTRISASK